MGRTHVLRNTMIAAVGLLLLASCCGCITHVMQQGTKVGTVIKLSQHGFFDSCKTWEGELLRGGMQGGSGGFSTTPLHFTVNDPTLLKQVQQALDEQYEVEVTYTEYFGPMGCSSDSNAVFLGSLKRR